MNDATGAVRSTTIGPAGLSGAFVAKFATGPTFVASSVTEFAVITGTKFPSLQDETSTLYVQPATIGVSVKTHPSAAFVVAPLVIKCEPKPFTCSLN